MALETAHLSRSPETFSPQHYFKTLNRFKNHFRKQEHFFPIQKLQRKQNKKLAVLYLLLNTKRVDITISDFPCNESIRVFTINIIAKKQQENNERSTKGPVVSHFLQTLSRYTLCSKNYLTSVCLDLLSKDLRLHYITKKLKGVSLCIYLFFARSLLS